MTRDEFEAGKPFEIDSNGDYKLVDGDLYKYGKQHSFVWSVADDSFVLSNLPFEMVRIYFTRCSLINTQP
jgi:hypothetical protein